MFLFLEYIQPAWYYSLVNKTQAAILADYEHMAPTDSSLISKSNDYETSLAQRMDYAYQALQKGYIPKSKAKKSDLQRLKVEHLADNYRFLQRYFGKAKTIYVLLIRIISFNNPLAELSACISTWRQKRQNLFENHFSHDDFLTFNSNLLQQKPLVSIIIPTLNRYTYLKNALLDLENQNYKHFEVLICDQSELINDSFYLNWKLDLTLIHQPEKALWLARNRCIQLAKGDYVLLFDDDSRVQPDWIEQHIKCLDFFNVSISAGVTHTLVGHGLSPKETYFHLSDVFDTGNAMVHRAIFESIGLFDRQFEKQRMGDGEFGLRALLAGFISISNPYAKRVHLKVETGGLRQMGSWDALRPKKLLAARPIPSVLYFIKKYFGRRQALYFIIQNVPFSFIPYNKKNSKLLKLSTLALLPLVFPLTLWTAVKSWFASNQKLKQGSIISKLQ